MEKERRGRSDRIKSMTYHHRDRPYITPLSSHMRVSSLAKPNDLLTISPNLYYVVEREKEGEREREMGKRDRKKERERALERVRKIMKVRGGGERERCDVFSAKGGLQSSCE
jgi:hypothetical protein